MSSQQLVPMTLTAIQEELAKVPNAVEILNIPMFKDSWIEKRSKACGCSEGDAIASFEIERTLFAQKIMESDKLAKCEKITIWQALNMHCISGLSFLNEEAYIIPRGNKCVWQAGWKGNLKNINNRPSVKEVIEPQIVYSCDVFDYERTTKGVVIHKHKPMFPRPEDAQMHYVYSTVIHRDGDERTYMMDREEILQVMGYSESYKNYKKANGLWPDGKPMDKPFPLASPGQYWRKTLINRIENNTKNDRTQTELIIGEYANIVNSVIPKEDIEEAIYADEKTVNNKQEPLFGDGSDAPKNVDKSTGEVYEEPEYVNEPVAEQEPDQHPSGDTEEVDVVKSTFEDLD